MPKVSSTGCDVGHPKRMEVKSARWGVLLYSTRATFLSLLHKYLILPVLSFQVITQTQTRDTCDCYFSLYIVKFKSFWPTQVSARTESNIRKRNQAMPRTFSKRRSRFSSLWGLDTTSKRKTTGHPSINQASFRLCCPLSIAVCVLWFDPSLIYWSLLQVFVDKMEPAKKPLGSMFEDSASEKSVSTQSSLLYICHCWKLDVRRSSWALLVLQRPPNMWG